MRQCERIHPSRQTHVLALTATPIEEIFQEHHKFEVENDITCRGFILCTETAQGSEENISVTQQSYTLRFKTPRKLMQILLDLHVEHKTIELLEENMREKSLRSWVIALL